MERRKCTPAQALAAIPVWVLLAVLALVVVFALSPAGGQKDITSPIVGTVAPPIKGANLHGGQVDLDSFKGEWVLVNFFATWCPPCVQEHPELLSEDLLVEPEPEAVHAP